MDLIGFLYGFGFLHGVLLAGILLFSGRGNRHANAFMAMLVICIAIRFLFSWLIRADVFMSYPQWSLFSTPLDFAWGPLLYLYAYSMSGRALALKNLTHFIPCALLFAAPITLALEPREQQLEFLNYFWSDRQDPQPEASLLNAVPAFWRAWIKLHLHGSLFSIQFGIYCYLVLRQIHHHNLNLEQHYSYTDQMNLRWLRILTYMCVLFLVLFLAFNRARLVLFGQFEITALSPNMPFLFLILGLYIIGMGALYQRPIHQRSDNDPADNSTAAVTTEPDADAGGKIPHGPEVDGRKAPPAATKYARSGISIEDAQRYKIRLMQTMQEKKLYLDCDLTLRDLAEYADLSYHQASQVINGQMNQRFFSFVNNYRIHLAKELMADPATRKMAIVDLALEVGFKSKSSFYDAFKKVTQVTPTQFKKDLEQAA